ncbi:vitrin-like [Montipora capricornis]|uniref:vitrin-like n=1 Tax=Montipora capricornis TaxID=246305 RepID=UPI0035F17B8E
MCKVLLIVALVLGFATKCPGFIWERTKKYDVDPLERFQKVPPARETAKKLMRHYLGIDHGVMRLFRRRHRRSSEVDTSQFYAQFDAIFIIDSSGSIRKKDFKKTIHALQLLTGKADRKRRYAAITFSYNATVSFNFSSKQDAISNLRKIPFEAGKTNTQDALGKCLQELILQRENGARPGLRKRVLIVTDGQSNIAKEDTLYRALQVKSTGTQIFVIAVGRYMRGMSEIVGLASSTDAHLYRVADMEGLLKVVKMIPPWRIIKEYMTRSWLYNPEY